VSTLKNQYRSRAFPLQFFVGATLFLLAAFIVALRMQGASITDDREAIRDGLRWYNNWQTPLDASDVRCTGGRFERNEFAFCQPGEIEVDIWRNNQSGKVSRIFAHRHTKGGPLPSVIGWKKPTDKLEWSFPADELNQAGHDEEITTRFYQRTVEKARQHAWDEVSSISFPWVSRGDPEYHVYLSDSSRKVIGVLVFYVENGSISEEPNFTLDVPHHSIPPVAARNLADPARWYRVAKAR